MTDPKVAFLIDALPGLGGSERVLMAALEGYPSAPVYTLVYNAVAFAGTPLAHRDVHASWVQYLPFSRQYYRSYLPLLPFAVEHMNLGSYDTIISVHYAVAHGARLNEGQRHLSYVCTPLRYAWRDGNGYSPGSLLARHVAGLVFRYTRSWDRRVSQRVQSYAAVSGWAACNVRKAFGRDAQVIYPPVEVERFHPSEDRGDYFLVVSRLVRHKRVDLVVDAFSRLGLPLLVVGDGPERAMLERHAAANVRFLGQRADPEVADLMSRARAFVHAGEEDFGIALVEAQAAGCTVISYAGGAARESVSEMLHPLMFTEQTVDSLLEAIRCFERSGSPAHPEELAAHANRFRPDRFQEEFSGWIRAAEAG